MPYSLLGHMIIKYRKANNSEFMLDVKRRAELSWIREKFHLLKARRPAFFDQIVT